MTVFYSWQSDIPANTNRGFIEKAVESAISEVNARRKLGLTLEQNTRETPAAPDVVENLLHKIDNALVFIADVTPVTKAGKNPIPDPNVMLELGYAIKALTADRIVTIHNDTFGDVRHLPFDLGLKQPLTYRVDPDGDDKAGHRKVLADQIASRIEAILSKT